DYHCQVWDINSHHLLF
nr:immunoglobulin light chain junction region [Macaca mulatta]MOV66647.1 immunoglobulin light chain junction region [Macaca mulatta]MOV67363.1 immunoglobulin light chain junction region [Macaca mulatta]MOV67617.1 immunoglobulin light chain junction region [Macaca mulatta]MOV68108.1 immunoglobulin light chain junction region [Macaca mulatta]